MVRVEPVQSQAPLRGLPCRCKVSKVWALLCCFNRPQGELGGKWDIDVFKAKDLATDLLTRFGLYAFY